MSIEKVKEEMKSNTEKLLEEKSRISEQLNLTNTNFSILVAEYERLLGRIPCNLTLLEKVNQLTSQLKSTQNKYQLTELENKKQRSILSSKHLDYIWDLCDRTTLQCSRCLPGWTEHASRCFLLSNVEKTWENARVYCRNYKGDLAVVLNAADQAFLTNLTFQFKKANPGMNFHSAWIGLQDMVKEGVHFWVNGDQMYAAKVNRPLPCHCSRIMKWHKSFQVRMKLPDIDEGTADILIYYISWLRCKM
uniref:C-type lectin domain-containing protein n=1 Tax=Xiphophorus couchianus TaxID=32473 RepID=A0A3B5MJ03_9TELE